MSHYLDSLMQPRAIAVVGASEREDSAGGVIMRQLLAAGYEGKLYPINPKRTEVCGLKAYPSLDDLMAGLDGAKAAAGERPELAILAIPNGAIEAALESLARHGIKAATIYSTLVVEEDAAVVAPELTLLQRVKQRAEAAGILLCGGNCMAFYNFKRRVMAVPFVTRSDHRLGEQAGRIALITHSGSVFNSLVDSDARLDFAFAVSSGQELTTSAADYLDYALEQPEMVAVGLVLETVRDPKRFIAALEKAARKRIAVLVLKLGRTGQSAVLAQSHSGALVGNHGSYRALFAKYGVFEVETIADLGASLLLFQHGFGAGRSLPPGGLATIHDSGGERVLLVDLASDHQVPLAQLSPATTASLAARLEPGMLPVNPLDAWGTGRDNRALYYGGFEDLALDENVAIAAIIGDRQTPGVVDSGYYLPLLEQVRAQTSKPLALVSNHRGVGSDESMRQIIDAGFPVMDDVLQFLGAVKQLFDHRDRPPFEAATPSDTMASVVARWRPRIMARGELGEVETLELLRDIGLETTPSVLITDAESLAAVAETLTYPLVMKTAMPGIAHKSEVGGVKLNLRDFAAVQAAWEDLSQRLGPRVILAPMIDLSEGIEMIVGVSHDAQFGSILVFGFGGIYAETLQDTVTALPPLTPAMVLGQLRRLRGYRLLEGQRGKPPMAIDRLVEAIVKLGQFVTEYGDGFGDLDINPILVTPKKAIALDGFLNHC